MNIEIKYIKRLFICFCIIVLFTCCKEDKQKNVNNIYYWKTTFELSNSEKYFLKENNVERIYLHYFDICLDVINHDAIPEGTIRFKDHIPIGYDIVPTIFIDNEVFKYCDMNNYVDKLFKRVMTMSNTNNIINVNQVQIDCDWTKTTEKAYFEFLKRIRKEFKKEGISLSTTIRLHQLFSSVPPVDRGVLMCYNTGAIKDYSTQNSIISEKDVSPYAKQLKKYKLPLDIAYPTFSWAVWFSNGEFKALLRDIKPNDKRLTLVKGNIFKAKEEFYQEGKYIKTNDEIRFEFSSYDEIIKVKNLLENKLKNYSIIIYHLDSTNLSKYSKHEINKIYSH